MSLTRLNLPQAFNDAISKVGLQQPIPAFAFARVLFSAVAAAQLRKALPEGVPIGATSLESNMMPLDPIRAQLVTVFDELMGKGHEDDTVKIRRPAFSGGGYTTGSRLARAESATSIVPISVTGEITSITLQMYEGPYDSANSRVAPYAFAPHQVNGDPARFGAELFDQLDYDRWAFVDAVLLSLCEANANHIVGSDPSGSMDGTVMATVATNAFLAAGDRPLDCDAIMRGKVKLRNNKIKPLPNGRYAAFLSTNQILDLTRDPDWKEPSKELESTNILAGALVNSIHGVDIYEVNNLNTGTSGGGATPTYQKGFMLGAGALGYAPGSPCSVEPSHDTNYGKQLKFVWQAVEGYVRLDDRMGVSLLSD